MKWRAIILGICVAALLLAGVWGSERLRGKPAPEELLAPAPPMGWNSYDAYGATVNEAEFKENAEWFAKHLKPYGWQYVVIDFQWYVANPGAAGNLPVGREQIAMDSQGRYVPAENRFPSSAGGKGFKPLADYAHSLGLKLGFHILRGIPKEAAGRNLAIAGSAYRAAEAAVISDKPPDACPWNSDNYGVSDTPAGQAYYDSIARLYADWGADFIKVDCIASHPYKGDEIRMLSRALRKTGRPMVLSLSPGPAPLEEEAELARYAQTWRISDDVWDLWRNDKGYPQGIGNQFERAAEWARFSGPGHWPDADMLPVGQLEPAPGWGPPRQTRLTHDEQRTMLTLWAMLRSPLMAGGDLTAADAWTVSLLTNREVIAVDQHSRESRAAVSTADEAVWVSQPEVGGGYYVAAFNLSASRRRMQYGWRELGVPPGEYSLEDLWDHARIPARVAELDVTVPAHGCALVRISQAKPR